MTSEFFFDEESYSLVLGDPPGIFVRIDPEVPDAVRLHIQFSDNELRSAKTMLRAWPLFSEMIWKTGIKKMKFDSKSPKLIGFCCRCFGFKKVSESEYELVREGR